MGKKSEHRQGDRKTISKQLHTRRMTDQQKINKARRIIRKYGISSKGWRELCAEEKISVQTFWVWVEKYGLEKEKKAALNLADHNVVKYAEVEEVIPVKEAADGSFIPLEDTAEYQLRAYAIQRICVRYGAGQGKLNELFLQENLSRHLFYKYLENFPELRKMYDQAKDARTRLLRLSMEEVRIDLAEGILASLQQQVRPVESERVTVTTQQTIVGYDEETDEPITADQVIKKVQTETKLPTAQILALAAKMMGWITSEDQMMDGADIIADVSNVQLVNERDKHKKRLEELRERKQQTRQARLGD